jgi:hypothetical protein
VRTDSGEFEVMIRLSQTLACLSFGPGAGSLRLREGKFESHSSFGTILQDPGKKHKTKKRQKQKQKKAPRYSKS